MVIFSKLRLVNKSLKELLSLQNLSKELFNIKKYINNLYLYFILFSIWFHYRIYNLYSTVNSTSTIKNPILKFFYGWYKTYRIIWVSFIRMFYSRIYGPISVTKNTSVVKFYMNNKWYYFPINVKNSPGMNIESLNEVQTKNETIQLISIMGPNHDFYGMNVKPKDLGLERINLIVDDVNVSFEKEEIVRLNK